MAKPKLGATVTTTEPEPAYYSNYGGLPECTFEPGDIGTVNEIDVPFVRKSTRGVYFACVDFTKHGREWRVALGYKQIRKV